MESDRCVDEGSGPGVRVCVEGIHQAQEHSAHNAKRDVAGKREKIPLKQLTADLISRN